MISSRKLATFLLAIAALAALPARAEKFDPNNLNWTVQILIDQSREPFPENPPATLPGQFFTPRDVRGLAISNDGRFLYAGYNNSKVRNDSGLLVEDRNGEVRMIDLTLSGQEAPFVTRILGNRGKAIAVDDAGRVYMAESDRVDIFSPDLSMKLFTVNSLTQTEGVAVTREAGQLVMYTSDRTTGDLTKWNVTENGADVSAAAKDGGFGVGGDVSLAAANTASLRGVEIDGAGNVWVAGFENNTLYRVSPDGTTIDTASINAPFDIGFNGDQVLVTHHTHDVGSEEATDRKVSIFDIADFEVDGIGGGALVEPPWEDLKLDEIAGNDETGDTGALSGIVVTRHGFYVANELGQTAGQKSTYGVTDQFSQNGFQDFFFDDNDPILYALVPEPGAILLAALAFAGLAGFRCWQCRRRSALLPHRS